MCVRMSINVCMSVHMCVCVCVCILTFREIRHMVVQWNLSKMVTELI